jgi:hypothetical protein
MLVYPMELLCSTASTSPSAASSPASAAISSATSSRLANQTHSHTHLTPPLDSVQDKFIFGANVPCQPEANIVICLSLLCSMILVVTDREGASVWQTPYEETKKGHSSTCKWRTWIYSLININTYVIWISTSKWSPNIYLGSLFNQYLQRELNYNSVREKDQSYLNYSYILQF